MKIGAAYWIAAGAVGAALLYVSAKGASKTGQAIGSAAADMATGVLAGATVGIGQTVGIPPTNETACQRDMAAGDSWAASFDCPAKDFISYAWGKL